MAVDRNASLVVALHQTTGLEPRLSTDVRPTMYKMVNKLLKYLCSHCTVYHVRAANLTGWSLEAATKRSHVESILAQTMMSPELHNIHESYEAVFCGG